MGGRGRLGSFRADGRRMGRRSVVGLSICFVVRPGGQGGEWRWMGCMGVASRASHRGQLLIS